MRKLFLVALVVGVCTSAIMAQESSNAGIYGGIQNLRFNDPTPGNQDGVSLPVAPKSTFLSALSLETARQNADKFPNNSRGASGRAGSLFQCPPSCPDDYNRVEIYAGYSLFLFDNFGDDDIDGDDLDDFFDDDRLHLNGVDLSTTFNFSRYVGAQFDFSFHRRREDFFIDVGLTTDVEASVSNFLFGIQVKDNSENGSRFRPFGHFLAGVSRQRLEIDNPLIGGDDFDFTETNFALALGGGIDIRVTENFSIRAIKFDYLPVFFDDFAVLGVLVDGQTQHNFRVGAGVVFHF